MKPKRGEIYYLKADAVGKRRPVLIVSRDELNGGHSVLAVPFTTAQSDQRRNLDWFEPFYAGEGGLDRDCFLKGDAVQLIEKVNLDAARGPLGRLDTAQLKRAMMPIMWSLKLIE